MKTYKVYILEKFGNTYTSKLICEANSIEQAYDKASELQSETGCTAYVE